LDLGDEIRATLDCTGGWYSVHDWSGIRLDRVLPATPGLSVVVRSVTGYARRLPSGDASRTWLATRLDGVELPADHGGPVRLVAPGRRGFWWVKWVSSIEIEDTPWWWQPPFPLA
jgi:DMSO/TMAO reductase YedYZ molybdopterin-dependent catalytic subunit